MKNKTDNSLVSVIMASYNAENYLHEAIDSVLSQTYKNWELFVIDDCSKDNSVRIIEEYTKNDNRIKLIASNINQGPGLTRNLGLKLAKGRYIAFLDSDDIWLDNKLELQIEFMSKYNCPISYTSYSIIDCNSKETGKVIEVAKNKIQYYDYLKNTIIGFSTSIIDTILVNQKIELVPLRSREDTFLWITLLKNKHIIILFIFKK